MPTEPNLQATKCPQELQLSDPKLNAQLHPVASTEYSIFRESLRRKGTKYTGTGHPSTPRELLLYQPFHLSKSGHLDTSKKSHKTHHFPKPIPMNPTPILVLITRDRAFFSLALQRIETG